MPALSYVNQSPRAQLQVAPSPSTTTAHLNDTQVTTHELNHRPHHPLPWSRPSRTQPLPEGHIAGRTINYNGRPAAAPEHQPIHCM